MLSRSYCFCLIALQTMALAAALKKNPWALQLHSHPLLLAAQHRQFRKALLETLRDLCDKKDNPITLSYYPTDKHDSIISFYDPSGPSIDLTLLAIINDCALETETESMSNAGMRAFYPSTASRLDASVRSRRRPTDETDISEDEKLMTEFHAHRARLGVSVSTVNRCQRTQYLDFLRQRIKHENAARPLTQLHLKNADRLVVVGASIARLKSMVEINPGLMLPPLVMWMCGAIEPSIVKSEFGDTWTNDLACIRTQTVCGVFLPDTITTRATLFSSAPAPPPPAGESKEVAIPRPTPPPPPPSTPRMNGATIVDRSFPYVVYAIGMEILYQQDVMAASIDGLLQQFTDYITALIAGKSSPSIALPATSAITALSSYRRATNHNGEVYSRLEEAGKHLIWQLGTPGVAQSPEFLRATRMGAEYAKRASSVDDKEAYSVRSRDREWARISYRMVKAKEFIDLLVHHQYFNAAVAASALPDATTYVFMVVKEHAVAIDQSIRQTMQPAEGEIIVAPTVDKNHRDITLLCMPSWMWWTYSVRGSLQFSVPKAASIDPNPIDPATKHCRSLMYSWCKARGRIWRRFSYVIHIAQMFYAVHPIVRAHAVALIRDWVGIGKPMDTKDENLLRRILLFKETLTLHSIRPRWLEALPLFGPLLAIDKNDNMVCENRKLDELEDFRPSSSSSSSSSSSMALTTPSSTSLNTWERLRQSVKSTITGQLLPTDDAISELMHTVRIGGDKGKTIIEKYEPGGGIEPTNDKSDEEGSAIHHNATFASQRIGARPALIPYPIHCDALCEAVEGKRSCHAFFSLAQEAESRYYNLRMRPDKVNWMQHACAEKQKRKLVRTGTTISASLSLSPEVAEEVEAGGGADHTFELCYQNMEFPCGMTVSKLGQTMLYPSSDFHARVPIPQTDLCLGNRCTWFFQRNAHLISSVPETVYSPYNTSLVRGELRRLAAERLPASITQKQVFVPDAPSPPPPPREWFTQTLAAAVAGPIVLHSAPPPSPPPPPPPPPAGWHAFDSKRSLPPVPVFSPLPPSALAAAAAATPPPLPSPSPTTLTQKLEEAARAAKRLRSSSTATPQVWSPYPYGGSRLGAGDIARLRSSITEKSQEPSESDFG